MSWTDVVESIGFVRVCTTPVERGHTYAHHPADPLKPQLKRWETDDERSVKVRTIRESPRFKLQCEELRLTVRRLDEVLRGATWAVAKHPERLPLIPNTDLRIVLTKPFPDVSALRIFFRIADENYVDLEGIETVQEDPSEPADRTDHPR